MRWNHFWEFMTEWQTIVGPTSDQESAFLSEFQYSDGAVESKQRYECDYKEEARDGRITA
jgi:hypothetical protein